MKSEWRITSNVIDGTKYYAIYRLRDIERTDHSGNREFFNEALYDDREQATKMAEKLNREEQE